MSSCPPSPSPVSQPQANPSTRPALRLSKTLSALTSAALAIPGLAPNSQADSVPAKTEIGYRHAQYQEANLPASDVAVGSNQRYDINVHQFRLITPYDERHSLEIRLDQETMSGASPRGVSRNSEGKLQLVMSGASIKDNRLDLNINATRYYAAGTTSVLMGFSNENDYQAYNLGMEAERHSQDRRYSWSAGLGISSDSIEPTQEAGFERVDKENKTSVSSFIGVSMVINSQSAIQTSLSVQMHDGFLTDPYKSFDQRPGQRTAIAWLTRYRYFYQPADAAVHIDYRFYNDDWGINASTFYLAWQQNIDDHLRVIPSLRYYSQSQANFYLAFDDPNASGERSSDYRLSPFGAYTLGIKAVAHTFDWQLSAALERYHAGGSLALGEVEQENPALVQYTLLSAGFEYLF